jgi:hypothetical protein
VPVRVVDKLDSFTSEFAIIPKEQCGFTKGNDWSSLVDLGKSVDMVFLDFAKAFDKVQINLLIAKLQMQRISGLLAWIAHFLSDRTFAVKVNGVLSDFFDVLSEVPQGSVLGPKLFLLYTADIPGLFLLRCAMFADDIKLYRLSRKWRTSDALRCRRDYRKREKKVKQILLDLFGDLAVFESGT